MHICNNNDYTAYISLYFIVVGDINCNSVLFVFSRPLFLLNSFGIEHGKPVTSIVLYNTSVYGLLTYGLCFLGQEEGRSGPYFKLSN